MQSRCVLALDIGSNSVGSLWLDRITGQITTGISIFPAGVDETDDKRGEPKNAKRRMTRRTRITLGRRAERKRELRLKLIEVGLLPPDAVGFKELLEQTDPWELRRQGLDHALTPHEFGRVLLHLSQRRGALGLNIADAVEGEEADPSEDGKVKLAIGSVRVKMLTAKARTFGEFIAIERDKRVQPLQARDQCRTTGPNGGPREYRGAIRNKAGSYEHCADRPMIRHEFNELWIRQQALKGETAAILTESLRKVLDDESGDDLWRHKGLLFGQRRQSWDLGTLGRCVLEPTERCAPHADMYASEYLVIETVNNLKIIERGSPPRPLEPSERRNIIAYLRGPLGMLPPKTIKDKKGKDGQVIKGKTIPARPKTSVTVTDLRAKMAEWYGKEKWPDRSKLSPCNFNIEADEDRVINTDWFYREIVHGAIGVEKWEKLAPSIRDGINRAIIKRDPDEEGEGEKLKAGVMAWAKLDEAQADALVAAWKTRPKPAKRLNMSRKAARNLLSVMNRSEPWPDPESPSGGRWLTQIEARKLIADDVDFRDATTGKPLDEWTRRRYKTGAKGATARDRYYMAKHVLLKDGHQIVDPHGELLREPPPAPLISNPVVRKAIHEVRRHIVEYLTTFGRKPDEVYVELAREAKMGKVDAERQLFISRLRDRVRKQIISEYNLSGQSPTQQNAAVLRVVLCAQQGGEGAVCPLCGKAGLTLLLAARGDGCEVAHIFPKGQGGHDGLTNLVLAHTRCNRDMGRRTPKAFWDATLPGKFQEGMRWVEDIYGAIQRIKPSETKGIESLELWKCYTAEQARPRKGSLSDKPPNYFSRRTDLVKLEQFKRDKPPPDMTARQEAATKYAARQVLAYISDALFDGRGLPERSSGAGREDDERRIFATDGLWTSRLRREWGLFFDPHGAKATGLESGEKHARQEKDRGDHRHHAIDAVVIGYCTEETKKSWEQRERDAEKFVSNPSDEEQMENYRRENRLDAPYPYPRGEEGRKQFRSAVKRAVFGDDERPRPICHRPVKRKLIGELHEAFPRGPVFDRTGSLTDKFTKRISILDLGPNHLRQPAPESESDAVDRLSLRRVAETGVNLRAARKWARNVVRSPGYHPAIVDPPPDKSGLVRDPELRRWLRKLLADNGRDPDSFSARDIKELFEAGVLRQAFRGKDGSLTAAGPPIKNVILLWTIKSPVIVSRWTNEYATGQRRRLFDADARTGDVRALRAYIGGNQHHIEFRLNSKGEFEGTLVTMFEASQRKLGFFRALRAAGVPRLNELKQMPLPTRRKYTPAIRAADQAHALVDRLDNDEKGGRFVMSISEGDMLWMLHKDTGHLGYFVVAKLDSARQFVVVPHWDARAAGLRKDSNDQPVPNSKRERFTVTLGDLRTLAPPGRTHAVKVRVSPLGVVTELKRD